MAAVLWDASFLSGYLNIPEATLNTAIDSPTAELVKAVLDAVAAKAIEHQELEADKIRLDIELENAVRSAENRAQTQRVAVDKALKEVDGLREQLNAEGGNHIDINLR